MYIYVKRIKSLRPTRDLEDEIYDEYEHHNKLLIMLKSPCKIALLLLFS